MAVIMEPDSVIEMELGLEPYGEAHNFFASECRNRMNERYVPEKSGVLHDTSYIDSECNIHYDQPYAGYQYYGMRKDGTHVISHWTKPGTGPYWDNLMITAEGKELEQVMQDYISKRGRK